MLDGTLGGGLDAHGLTELAGAAGAGKTQLALQCMLQVQLPPSRGGLGGGAVFLHADTPSYMAPMRRLEDLAAAFAERHADLGATTERLMSHIHVMQLNSADALLEVLQDTQWLRTKQVRLIVLDSIAGLYRGQLDGAGTSRANLAADRSRQLMHIAATLQKISDYNDVAVIVTNQITDKPLGEEGFAASSPAEINACLQSNCNGLATMKVPALGLGWSLGVNTRLVLTRRDARDDHVDKGILARVPKGQEQDTYAVMQHNRSHDDLVPYGNLQRQSPNASMGGRRRELHVIFSPRVECRCCRFEVYAHGVFGVC